MNKRTIANILSFVGAPAYISWMGIQSSFTASGSKYNFLWAVPLAIASLPLLPFALQGDNLALKCDKEEFDNRTKDLPKVNLPKDHCYIEYDDSYGKSQWFIQGCFADEDAFDSYEECTQFLDALGYQEVVSDCEYGDLSTYWIRTLTPSNDLN